MSEGARLHIGIENKGAPYYIYSIIGITDKQTYKKTKTYSTYKQTSVAAAVTQFGLLFLVEGKNTDEVLNHVVFREVLNITVGDSNFLAANRAPAGLTVNTQLSGRVLIKRLSFGGHWSITRLSDTDCYYGSY